MFIESFKLKKDGWHMKLMNFIWGVTPRDFSHICPYWWATIGTLLLIVPLGLWTLLKLGLRNLGEWLDDLIIESRDKRRQKKWDFKTRNGKEIFKKLQNPDFFEKIVGSCKNKFDSFRSNELSNVYSTVSWEEWMKLNDKIRERREAIEAHYRQVERDKELKIFQDRIKRKQMITQATNVIRPVIKGLLYITGIAAALFVAYLLFKLGAILIKVDYSFLAFWNWPWISIMKVVFWFVAGGGGLILLVWLLRSVIKALSKWADNFCPPKWMNSIGAGFSWFFTGIGTIFAIIGQMIKDNCPSIDWED